MSRRPRGTAPQPPHPRASSCGVVVAAHRRHFVVRCDDGTTLACVLKGRSLALACGDRVRIEPTVGGGAIEELLPRSTLLYRSDAFKEKLVAANVTQVVGVVAPDLGVDEELVHRWAVAAEEQRCRMILVVNKADLPEFPALFARLEPLRALDVAVVAVAALRDVEPVRPWLAGQRSVLIGQSGMGKSTLLNAIVPGAAARTGEISAALGTGRHTTTHSALYMLPPELGDGWLIDTPGVRAFGLAHVEPASIPESFVEMRPLLGQCRFRDCGHGAEPGCALRAAADSGAVAPHRLALLRALVAESRAVRSPGR